MIEAVDYLTRSPYSGLLILLLTLAYLGAKKYVEKYSENLADLHTKDWK